MLRVLLSVFLVLLLCGCASTVTMHPVNYQEASRLKAGKWVRVHQVNGITRSVKLSGTNETGLVGVDGQAYPYESVDRITYDNEPPKALLFPLLVVYYSVSIVYGTVVLTGSVACFMVSGSQKCGALLTS